MLITFQQLRFVVLRSGDLEMLETIVNDRTSDVLLRGAIQVLLEKPFEFRHRHLVIRNNFDDGLGPLVHRSPFCASNAFTQRVPELIATKLNLRGVCHVHYLGNLQISDQVDLIQVDTGDTTLPNGYSSFSRARKRRLLAGLPINTTRTPARCRNVTPRGRLPAPCGVILFQKV